MVEKVQVEGLVEEVRSKMSIVEKEEEGVVIEWNEGGDEELDYRWCMIGMFVTEKPIKYLAMRSTMGDLWKPGRGVFVKDLEANLFAFQFFNEIDFNRAVEGAPWSWDNALLAWKKLEVGDNPRLIQFEEAEFWIQVYGKLDGMRSERVCQTMGNYVGRYISSDRRNFDREKAREFIRVRIAIDYRQHLMRSMKIKKAGGDWVELAFKYERVPSFCFICGVIGHGERSCEVLYENPALAVDKPYGAWLRAPLKVEAIAPISKWLRNAKGERLEESVVEGGGRVVEGGGRGVGDGDVWRGGRKESALTADGRERFLGLTKLNVGSSSLNSAFKSGASLNGTNGEIMLIDGARYEEHNEEEGVTVLDNNRQRVEFSNEEEEMAGLAGTGLGLSSKPSGPEAKNGPRVGPGSQAHLAK